MASHLALLNTRVSDFSGSCKQSEAVNFCFYLELEPEVKELHVRSDCVYEVAM